MNGIEGRIRWNGPDPDVTLLTHNKTERTVMLRVAWQKFELAIPVKDTASLIAKLEEAQEWAEG